jgi:hypothetical protein
MTSSVVLQIPHSSFTLPLTPVIFPQDPAIDAANYFCLTNRERDTLKQALDQIIYDDSGRCEFISHVRPVLAQALPRRLRTALEAQRASLTPRPYVIIDNLPVDDEVFGSPRAGESGSSYKSGTISENLAVGIAALIGEPYSVQFEGADIVNNLTPQRGNEKEFTGLGSAVELDFHIENAALKFHSDFNLTPVGLLLTGVREDPVLPKTRFSDARLALSRLSAEDKAVLRSRRFSISVPYRWRQAFAATNAVRTDPVPLISGDESLPEIHAVFYPDMVQALDDEAKAAFDRFYEAIKAVSFALDVTPGRLVYADNRFTLHSRDSFTASYDANGCPMRWLQRVFVTANLWSHRGLRRVRGRVFQPEVGHG